MRNDFVSEGVLEIGAFIRGRLSVTSDVGLAGFSVAFFGALIYLKNTMFVAFWGVFQQPLTLILLKQYRDTNGRRIVIQIGGVYATFCQAEGILLQKYRNRNRDAFQKYLGVRGRCDSPE